MRMMIRMYVLEFSEGGGHLMNVNLSWTGIQFTGREDNGKINILFNQFSDAAERQILSKRSTYFLCS